MSKRKKHQGMRCVLFPDDVKDVFRKSRKEPVKTSTPGKAWERCGDSFLDTSVVQNLQTSEKKSRRVRKEVQTHVTGVREAGADDPVNIAWSSSEAEESDNESHPRPAVIQTPQTSKRHRHHPVDHHRSLRMLGATVDEDDLPSIDSDSEAEEDNSTSKDQTDFLNPIASPAEISVYSSNDDEDPEENRTDSSLVDTADTSRQSVSEWVRSAQAILQTPKKPTTTTIKTPEDSNKKNRKFERGGLAEKLNRLHSRQRSAISFWRHQCNSSASAADRPGVLTLRILGVREECGMQAAVCDRLPENEKCVAMFSKDTAAQLQPTPGDIVHIYPPWQNLVVEGERFPVILNTHFSQKVCVETDNTGCLTSVVSVEKCRPPQLTPCLWRSEMSQSERSVSCEQPQVSELSRSDRRCVRDSLLDAVEDCGLPGSQSGPVEVVVQRLYCIPISSDRASLQHRNPGKHPSRPEPSDRVGRLCAIVQDGYGMFADVLLQSVSDAEIKKISEELEGRICVLQGLRVIQRLTRDRCSSLFSLIDSLWPPLVAPKSHEDLLQSPSGRVPPPNFCYRLSVQQGRMVPVSGQNMSPLYQPPVLRTLREITQEESMKRRCSFRAALVHKHLLGSNTGEMLLFVTDPSLQTDPSAEAIRKTVSVCVSPSCLMQSSVTQALTESQRRPLLRFRDAVINRGQLFCVEQTVIELEPDEPSFSVSRTVILDQLSPDIPPYSLCSLTGVIVEVDESTAFSWPACCQCGSCRLETAQIERRRFHCLMCGAVMDEPTTKMQLEVFLTCPSMRHCNVKVKLQQKTITSLLNSTRGAEGYTVESILGREIGPLSVLVHVINRRPNVWMVLEEFDLP